MPVTNCTHCDSHLTIPVSIWAVINGRSSKDTFVSCHSSHCRDMHSFVAQCAAKHGEQLYAGVLKCLPAGARSTVLLVATRARSNSPVQHSSTDSFEANGAYQRCDRVTSNATALLARLLQVFAANRHRVSDITCVPLTHTLSHCSTAPAQWTYCSLTPPAACVVLPYGRLLGGVTAQRGECTPAHLL